MEIAFFRNFFYKSKNFFLFYLSSGDCYEYYEPFCTSGSQKCSIYAPKRKLSACDKYSEYLEVKYYCIPGNLFSIR